MTFLYNRRSGTCTICMQKCLEGEMDQGLALDDEIERGWCLRR